MAVDAVRDVTSARALLEQAIDELNQEANSLTVVGRALTQEELARLDQIHEAIEAIEYALRALGDPDGIEEPIGFVGELRDGSWLAVAGDLRADVRIDLARDTISLDLFRVVGDSQTYLGSARTYPEAAFASDDRAFPVVIEDTTGSVTTGTLELDASSATLLDVYLRTEAPLAGVPSVEVEPLKAVWVRDALRRIGLEIDREMGVDELPTHVHHGDPITVTSSFREAGIELYDIESVGTVPTSSHGWHDAELHALMESVADVRTDVRDWMLHLLLLSSARNPDLLGVMFDSGVLDTNQLPRQGVAVFTDPMQSHSAGFERKLIQTTAHELGHALNLAHRFERRVGRADSLSFMNYDWRYGGGGRRNEFWNNFDFRFDDDEEAFLRHAPWPKIVPGGAEFATVRYWADGGGGYSPYVPEVPISNFELRLLTPVSGALFEFSQPVFLTAELENKTNSTYEFWDDLLDPKAGFLEILIERESFAPPIGDRARMFRPVANRCYDLSATRADEFGPGAVLSRNLNLTFGAAGFTFAEPGNYRIMGVLAFYDPMQGIEYIVRSSALAIRIAHPQSLEEEQDALRLFRRDVGMYLAFGGSDELQKAEQVLQDVSERRCRRRQIHERDDPLAVYVRRCRALNASRDFVRFTGKEWKRRRARPQEALEIVRELVEQPEFFDPATVRAHKRLEEQLSKESQE